MGRRLVLGAGAATVVLAASGTVLFVRDSDADTNGSDDQASEATAQSTAEVTVKDLQERDELDGTLGYGDATDLSVNAQGTITALPDEGSIIDRGQMAVEVDGLAVPLLFADRPFWRPLAEGADDGSDITELEFNLAALGYDPGTVDGHWSSATTAAMKKWQKDLGREQTGTFNPGDVAVAAGPVRVADHPTPVGSPAQGPVLKVTSSSRQVSVDLEASKQSMVKADQAVEVELPDGSVVNGKVSSVGTVAQASSDPNAEDTEPTIEVVVTLDDPAAGGNLDEAPVTVRLVTTAAEDVLTVPVDALLALAEGGYAVEVVDAAGTTSLVPVETGAFADGWVEVSGEIAEGDKVVVPA